MIRDRRPAFSKPYGLSVWLIGLAVWLTWAPFAGRDAAPEVRLVISPNPGDIIGNLLLLVPIAVAIILAIDGQSVSRSLRLALTMIATISIVLEAGQWFVIGRVVSPWDPCLNIAGAFAAAWGTLYLTGLGVRRRTLLAAISVSAFLASAGYLIKSAADVRRDFRLNDWRAEYPIVVGDEFGGDRRYRGQIQGAMICAGRAPAQVCAEPGAAESLRWRLVEQAQSSQTVRLSAIALPAADTMSGPARIVTFSLSPGLRNATLAQEDRDLVFRVRTPLTGENGSRPQLILPSSVYPQATMVSAEFAEGTVRLSAESEGKVASATFHFGLLDSWLPARELRSLPPAPLRRAGIVGAFVLLLPIGLVLGWKHGGRGASFMVILTLVCALAALEHLWLGLPLRLFSNLALPVAVVLLGAWLGRLDRPVKLDASNPTLNVDGQGTARSSST